MSLECLEGRENPQASLVPSLLPGAQHMVNTINVGPDGECLLSSDDLGDAMADI